MRQELICPICWSMVEVTFPGMIAAHDDPIYHKPCPGHGTPPIHRPVIEMSDIDDE